MRRSAQTYADLCLKAILIMYDTRLAESAKAFRPQINANRRKVKPGEDALLGASMAPVA